MEMLPFSHEQFLGVFAAYNEAVWPAQIAAYLLGAAVCIALTRSSHRSGTLVAIGLGVMWLWTGVAYHVLQFARINPAAIGFGALFVLQGCVFLIAGARQQFRFAAGDRLRAWFGWGLIAYSMVLYPLIGFAAGAAYPRLPMFGITPCPVTLFTFGALLLACVRLPWWMLVIPFAWSLLGGTAAILLAVPQDWVLFFSGLALVPIALRNRQLARRNSPQGSVDPAQAQA